MTIHVLVEGPSERAFLEPWCARLLKGHPVRVHPHRGKGSLPKAPGEPPDPERQGLLDQLPAKLRGFADSLDPKSDSVVVLVDADDEVPADLMRRLAKTAADYGPSLNVVVRLAVEEMEAFYFGDLRALEKAFPDADMKAAREYKPDSICETWELFGRIVHDGGGNKVAWADAMSKYVTTQARASRSPSFRDLLTSLAALVPASPSRNKVRPYRHPPRKPRDPGGRR